MRWLSPRDPSNRHQGVRTERFEGVGNWLLEMTRFLGSGDVVRVEPIRLSCFALGIREWAKHISGKWPGSLKELNATDGPEY